MLKKLLIACAFAGLVGGPAFAQTYNTTTTIATAVSTRQQTVIAVASSTGMVASATTGQSRLFVDGELMLVTAINGNNLTVSRGYSSTAPSIHAASAVVIWGPASMFVHGFTTGQSTSLAGQSCTASQYAYLPIVDVDTGNVWLCRATAHSGIGALAYWTATNNKNITYNSLLTNLN